MKIKIIADSAADTLTFEGVDYESVPLTISTVEKDYIDDETLHVDEMVKYFRNYNDKSSTACPSVGRWLQAYEGYDEIYVVTITSKLSGSYNSAIVAKDMYLEEHPNAKIHVFDSLSTGPHMRLLIEKLNELISNNLSFEEVVKNMNEYYENTKLFFSLESIHNLATNGRVSKLSDIATRLLNIRIIGMAKEGVLHMLNKCAGAKKAFRTLMGYVVEKYNGNKIRIAHVNNPNFVEKIKEFILEHYKNAQLEIYRCKGLCSYYSEEGGVLVAIETK